MGVGTVDTEGVKPNFCPIWNNSVSRESGMVAAATAVHPLYYAAVEGSAA